MTIPDKMKNLKMAIIPTWRCNLTPRCGFCSQGLYASSSDELPVSLIKKQTDDVVKHAAVLELVGGEITAWKPAFEYMDHICKMNPACNLMVHTNGVGFNRKWSEFCVERYIQPWISLNASSAQAYERAVDMGAVSQSRYHTIRDNLDQYLELWRERNPCYPRLRVTMVATENTQQDMIPFAVLAGDLNVDVCFQFDSRTNQDGSFPGWILSGRDEAVCKTFFIKNLLEKKRSLFVGGIYADEWLVERAGEFTDDIISNKERSELLSAWEDASLQDDYEAFAEAQKECRKTAYSFEEYLVNGCYTIKEIQGTPVCSAPWEGAYIYPNGNVKVCCFSSRVIGNIKHKSLAEILDGDSLRKLQQELVNGNTSSCSAICAFRHAMDWEIDCKRLLSYLHNPEQDISCCTNRSAKWLDAVVRETEKNVSVQMRESNESCDLQYARLAMIYYQEKNYKEALRLWEKSSSESLPSWMVLRHAAALFAVGRKTDAEELVDETYRNDPAAMNGYALWGWLLFEEGVCDQNTNMYFQKDASNARLSPGFALNYACFLADTGNVEEAEEQVERAYKQSKSLKDGYARMAWTAWIHRKCISAEKAMEIVAKDISSHRISREWFVRFTSRLLEGCI